MTLPNREIRTASQIDVRQTSRALYRICCDKVLGIQFLLVIVVSGLSTENADSLYAGDSAPKPSLVSSLSASEFEAIQSSCATFMSPTPRSGLAFIESSRKYSTSATAAILSCALAFGTPNEKERALGVIASRRDIQPFFIPQTLQLMTSKEEYGVRISRDHMTSQSLAVDAILTVAVFDPHLLEKNEHVRRTVLQIVQRNDNSADEFAAAIAFSNLFGANDQTNRICVSWLNHPPIAADTMANRQRNYAFFLGIKRLQPIPTSVLPALLACVHDGTDSDSKYLRRFVYKIVSKQKIEEGRNLCYNAFDNERDPVEIAAAAAACVRYGRNSDEFLNDVFARVREHFGTKLEIQELDINSCPGCVRQSFLDAVLEARGLHGMVSFLELKYLESADELQRDAIVMLLDECSKQFPDAKESLNKTVLKLLVDPNLSESQRKAIQALQ